jgi:uncharacterized protein YndB with AHSA1/START domain
MAARSADTEATAEISGAADTADREIRLSRTFPAPPELVWEAFTDPRHVVNWWGPRGFTTSIETMDVRPGGVWKHVMKGPDGALYPNHTVYTDVEKPRLIAYKNSGRREGEPGTAFHAFITFAPEGGGTRVTLRMVFTSASARDRVIRDFGAVEGGKSTLERMAEFLPRLAATERDFVLSRTFDAPRERVFEAWTDPKQLARWWGPAGFTNPACEMDVRPGGRYRIVMRSPEGQDYPISGEFREVVRPSRLVMTIDLKEHPREFFEELDALRPAAERGNPFRPTMTVTFEEAFGRTTVTVSQRYDSIADRDASAKLGALEGWGQSFERLDALLGREES